LSFTTAISTAASTTAIPPYHFHDGQYDCFGVTVGKYCIVRNYTRDLEYGLLGGV